MQEWKVAMQPPLWLVMPAGLGLAVGFGVVAMGLFFLIMPLANARVNRTPFLLFLTQGGALPTLLSMTGLRP
ncbi:MAG: hypothetical protein ACOY94_00335 [Bacillota bacterium]